MIITKELVQSSILETQKELYRLEGTLKALHAVLQALDKPESTEKEASNDKAS